MQLKLYYLKGHGFCLAKINKEEGWYVQRDMHWHPDNNTWERFASDCWRSLDVLVECYRSVHSQPFPNVELEIVCQGD